MPRFIRFSLVSAVLFTMISCSFEDRPIPADLPSQEREALRRLPVEGAENFRDIGGYKTPDGHSVKWGKLYRSGQLHDLSRGDREYLLLLGIRSVADFRGPSEVEKEPDNLPEGIKYLSYPVDVAGSDLREKVISLIKGDAVMDVNGYMIDVNRRFAEDYPETFGKWIKDLANNPDLQPQVFHCTAGKDRTGFAAAILLRILGVPEETVMADYLKSNGYNADYIEKTIKKIRILSFFKNDGEVIRPLLSVDHQYLQTAFDAIDGKWGSFDNYVRRGLNLSDDEITALRDRFLE